MRSLRVAAAVALAPAVLALVAACGSSDESPPAPAAPGTTTTTDAAIPDTGTPSATVTSGTGTSGAAAVEELEAEDSALGTIVTDGRGMTLYMFTRDTQGGTTSACEGQCLTAWPPAIASGTPEVDGVTGTVGTIDTADGRKQLTLNGWPLYYFAQDQREGDVTGQGVNEVWFVLSPAGEPIRSAPGGATTSAAAAAAGGY